MQTAHVNPTYKNQLFHGYRQKLGETLVKPWCNTGEISELFKLG